MLSIYMRSAQSQVELRRLVNQLTLLGKANSLCTVVKLCVLLPVCDLVRAAGYMYAGCGLSQLGQNPCSV